MLTLRRNFRQLVKSHALVYVSIYAAASLSLFKFVSFRINYYVLKGTFGLVIIVFSIKLCSPFNLEKYNYKNILKI